VEAYKQTNKQTDFCGAFCGAKACGAQPHKMLCEEPAKKKCPAKIQTQTPKFLPARFGHVCQAVLWIEYLIQMLFKTQQLCNPILSCFGVKAMSVTLGPGVLSSFIMRPWVLHSSRVYKVSESLLHYHVTIQQPLGKLSNMVLVVPSFNTHHFTRAAHLPNRTPKRARLCGVHSVDFDHAWPLT